MPTRGIPRLWPYVLGLYLISFALPYGGSLGVALFLFSLLLSPAAPQLALLWVANPLFWAGLAAFRGGRHGRAAAFGIAASFFASIPLMLMDWHEVPSGADPSVETSLAVGLILWAAPMAAHLAWAASMFALAGLATIGWASDRLKAREPIRIRAVMALVAAIALLIAAAPYIRQAVVWACQSRGGGWGMG